MTPISKLILLIFLIRSNFQAVVLLDKVDFGSKPHGLDHTSDPNKFLVVKYDTPTVHLCTVAANA